MRLIAALLLVGCAHQDREVCYAQVDADFVQKAVTECRDSKWSDCPFRNQLLAEHMAAYRSCP